AVAYEVAPTASPARFAAGPKAAACAFLLRIFARVPAATQYWFWAFWILAVVTMFVGNLGAVVQTNVKRMLAYSSIAHAGYTLVAFAAVTFLHTDPEIGPWAAADPRPLYLLGYSLPKVSAVHLHSA